MKKVWMYVTCLHSNSVEPRTVNLNKNKLEGYIFFLSAKFKDILPVTFGILASLDLVSMENSGLFSPSITTSQWTLPGSQIGKVE